MTDMTDEILQALRLTVHNDPTLQARLFGLTDEHKFIAAALQVAQSLGYAVEEEAMRQAMRNGRKAWFERNLPC